MERDPALLEAGNAAAARSYLDRLLRRPDPQAFAGALRRLHVRFTSCVSTSPAPLPAPGLIITGEIRLQSELYLPIAEISAVFTRLYRSSLNYPPLLASTPFADSSSWADLCVALPAQFQLGANPGRLLEALLSDSALLTEFLFASFLPRRFYGGFRRYPLQGEFVRTWLASVPKMQKKLRCLDAACGSGEQTYVLAGMLREAGYTARNVAVEGWTIEPLEVWAAASRRYPHDRRREELFREATDELLESGYGRSISFRCADLLHSPGWTELEGFDLILCNGLLGGPIIHEAGRLRRAVENLAALLAPGGVLLAADNFHGGWKKQIPGEVIAELFRTCGLRVMEAGEGIGGVKSRTSNPEP